MNENVMIEEIRKNSSALSISHAIKLLERCDLFIDKK